MIGAGCWYAGRASFCTSSYLAALLFAEGAIIWRAGAEKRSRVYTVNSLHARTRGQRCARVQLATNAHAYFVSSIAGGGAGRAFCIILERLSEPMKSTGVQNPTAYDANNTTGVSVGDSKFMPISKKWMKGSMMSPTMWVGLVQAIMSSHESG